MSPITALNLLPPQVLRRRHINRLVAQITALQAVIFLLAVLSVWYLAVAIGTKEAQAEALAWQLQNERFAMTEATIMALRAHQAQTATREEAFDWVAFPAFDARRFALLAETLPPDVDLIRVDMNPAGAVLTGHTQDLRLADFHRAAWAASGLVESAWLASVARQDDGQLQYDLVLRWYES